VEFLTSFFCKNFRVDFSVEILRKAPKALGKVKALMKKLNLNFKIEKIN
jgi:hypothetical protein